MKIVTDFPRATVEFPDMGIVMPDGCRLSARVWMPADAEANPVPAILEHLPYRKRDGTCQHDSYSHPYFAGHGYACIRVDMRGNGDSEGLMDDEYSEQEWQRAKGDPQKEEADINVRITPDEKLEKRSLFSVSQLEKYAQCAFKYFAENVLHLSEPPSDSPDEDLSNLERGNILHRVLFLFYQEKRK